MKLKVRIPEEIRVKQWKWIQRLLTHDKQLKEALDTIGREGNKRILLRDNDKE